MESINGLPAHPLFVHAPIVLVPLAAIAALVVAAAEVIGRRPGRLAHWVVAGAAAVGLVATQLAVSSGYRFDEIAGKAVDTSDHEALGETTRNLVALFLVAALITAGLAGTVAGGDRSGRRRLAVRAGVALTTLSAIMSTIWMVRTGDEGARLVWDGVLLIRRR
jgi:hypothetical protein